MYPFTEAGGQTRLPSVCNISIWYYQVVREEHSMQYDLIIRHAHLHRRDGLVDIAVKDVKSRVLEEVRWEVAQGTLHIRSHVDVCDPALTALRALIEVREEVRDICNLQLVAFPQDGIMSFPNGRELMRQAMVLGCDLVG